MAITIFDHESLKSIFSFPEFVPACKNISWFHLFILEIQLVLSPMTRLATSILDHARTNIFQHLPACKISSQFHLFILQIQSILESRDQIGHTHFLTISIQKFLISLWLLSICINMQRMTLPLKFVSSAIWLVESILVNISGTRFFPKTGLCRITANNVNFYYRTNSVKINDQFFF